MVKAADSHREWKGQLPHVHVWPKGEREGVGWRGGEREGGGERREGEERIKSLRGRHEKHRTGMRKMRDCSSVPSITALSCHIASPSSASQVRPVGLPSGEAFPVLVADQVRLPRDRCGEDRVTERQVQSFLPRG